MPTPLKKPAAPPVSAPSRCLVASPSKPLATLVTSEVAPAVTPYSACFGLLRNCRIRRWLWYCLSNVAADRPEGRRGHGQHPQLFTGSKARQMMRTFADTSRDFGERIAETEDRLLGETACAARDADTEVFVAVHHHTVVRLDEEVGHAGRDIREQPGGIAASQKPSVSCSASGNVGDTEMLTR